MLIIKYEPHIGEQTIYLPFDGKQVTITDVVAIQADGDELEHIRANYTGIPFANTRVMKWPQPFADMILANLFNKV